MNAENIAARRAQFYDKKERNKREYNSKKVLHEVVVRLNELFQLAEESTEDDEPWKWQKACQIHLLTRKELPRTRIS